MIICFLNVSKSSCCSFLRFLCKFLTDVNAMMAASCTVYCPAERKVSGIVDSDGDETSAPWGDSSDDDDAHRGKNNHKLLGVYISQPRSVGLPYFLTGLPYFRHRLLYGRTQSINFVSPGKKYCQHWKLEFGVMLKMKSCLSLRNQSLKLRII